MFVVGEPCVMFVWSSVHLPFLVALLLVCVGLQEMIDEADKDGDGEVSETEFLRIMKKTNMY